MSERPALHRTVVVLGVVSLLTDVAADMATPLLPAFLVSVGGGARALGLIEGVATATAALMKFVVGGVSDHMPRKKPLVLFGYALANAARPLLALAGAPWHVLAVRFVDRVGKGVRTAPRDALLARESRPEDRAFAFGFHRSMDNVGAVLGPLVAVALLTWRPGDVRFVFAATLVPGLLSVFAVAFGVREAAAPPDDVAKKPRASLTGPPPVAMRPYLALLALFTLANASDTFLLLRAEQLGLPRAQVPLAWGALSLLRALTGTPGGRLADRIGRGRALALGWVLYAVAYAGFGAARTPLEAAPALLAYGCYYGLSEGTELALVASLAPREELGRAYGWFYLVTGLLALPASLGFGLALDRGYTREAFAVCAALALVAAAGLLAWRRGRDG
jgi:MFS family permease